MYGFGLGFDLSIWFRFCFGFELRLDIGFRLRSGLYVGLRFGFDFGFRFDLHVWLWLDFGIGLRFGFDFGFWFDLGDRFVFSFRSSLTPFPETPDNR